MSKRIKTGSLEVLFKKRLMVEFAYLFGSAKSGVVPDGSDLDIAICFDHKPNIMELAALRADIQTTLHFEDIDLVVLNGASPILRFEALQGVRLFSRNREKEAVFASLTAREYEDEMGMLEKALK